MLVEEDLQDDSTNILTSTLKNCIRREDGDVSFGNRLTCLKEGAVAGLTDVDGRECVEVLEGVTLHKEGNVDGPLPRDLYSANFLDAAAHFIGRRYLKWDMNTIYPGLFMKIGPMLDNSGVLEFVMERGYPKYSDRTLSTGKYLYLIL
ncbi:hypothetical protein L9F63_006359 [Diploptera punctata]|uniref:Uncharacterized protein n=1 Tax=Diploptera punctata TaxID=6984 RepID=A0AAD8E516_DIPPU|nr:hypothetical protein L9F63_006359 [Diploptera punctata]